MRTPETAAENSTKGYTLFGIYVFICFVNGSTTHVTSCNNGCSPLSMNPLVDHFRSFGEFDDHVHAALWVQNAQSGTINNSMTMKNYLVPGLHNTIASLETCCLPWSTTADLRQRTFRRTKLSIRKRTFVDCALGDDDSGYQLP